MNPTCFKIIPGTDGCRVNYTNTAEGKVVFLSFWTPGLDDALNKIAITKEYAATAPVEIVGFRPVFLRRAA